MPKLHRTELPYDPIPRAVAQDTTVLFDALAAFVWARSLPDEAEVSVDELVAQGRGMGTDRAAKAVRCLREHGLWHTLTWRLPSGLLTSRVVVPPEPWTREQAAEAAGLDPEQLVDGPSDRRHLRAISAGGTDTRITEDRSTEDRSTDGRLTDRRSPGGDSLEQIKRTTPLTPRSAGGTVVDGCNQGHTSPSRGCCTPRAIRERAAAAARVARREQDRAAVKLPRPDLDAAGNLSRTAAIRAELAARKAST